MHFMHCLNKRKTTDTLHHVLVNNSMHSKTNRPFWQKVKKKNEMHVTGIEMNVKLFPIHTSSTFFFLLSQHSFQPHQPTTLTPFLPHQPWTTTHMKTTTRTQSGNETQYNPQHTQTHDALNNCIHSRLNTSNSLGSFRTQTYPLHGITTTIPHKVMPIANTNLAIPTLAFLDSTHHSLDIY